MNENDTEMDYHRVVLAALVSQMIRYLSYSLPIRDATLQRGGHTLQQKALAFRLMVLKS